MVPQGSCTENSIGEWKKSHYMYCKCGYTNLLILANQSIAPEGIHVHFRAHSIQIRLQMPFHVWCQILERSTNSNFVWRLPIFNAGNEQEGAYHHAKGPSRRVHACITHAWAHASSYVLKAYVVKQLKSLLDEVMILARQKAMVMGSRTDDDCYEQLCDVQ